MTNFKDEKMIPLRDIVLYAPARAEVVRFARKADIKILMKRARFSTITGNFTTQKTFFIFEKDIVPLYESLKERAKSKHHLIGLTRNLDEIIKHFENYLKKEN